MEEKLKVFMSSVIRDDELREERTTACEKIGTYMDILQPVCFDFTHSESIPPQDWSVENVQNCHIFVQLLDKTITDPVRNEYKTAKRENKQRIILLKRNSVRNTELDEYISSIKNDITYSEFSHLAEFENLLKGSLNTAVLNLVFGKDKAGQNTEDRIKRIEDFRVKQLDKIYSRVSPALLDHNYPKAILHIVPLNACERDHIKIDLESLDGDGRFKPLYSSGWGPMGREAYSALQYSTYRNHINSLVEVFENGVVEAIKVLSYDPDDKRSINTGYERNIVSQLPEYLSLLEQRDIQPPLYVALSFLEIQDWSIWLGPEYGYFPPVGENKILAKCGILDNFDEVKTPDQAARFMRPMFDVLWRAAHWPGSKNFDNEGNWKNL